MKTKDKARTTALQRPETRFFDEMDRAFDALTHQGWLQPFRGLWPDWAPLAEGQDVQMPRIDLIDRKTEVLVRAEVPGIGKDDLTVELTGELLTIAGERKHEEKTEEGNVYRAEISRGSFLRTIRLPCEVNPDKVDAVFENGVLEVHLPKLEPAAKQRIDVK
jgi:HSP20 family protein